MFALLRNKFSNYRTCLLRFEINFPIIERVRFASISKKTSLSKLSLRFPSITLSFAFDVYTKEACDVPGGFYTTGA